MTLYKGTLEHKDLGDDEPQVEPAGILFTLKITEEITFGLELLIGPGASHNFISFEAWQTLPKGSMVPLRCHSGCRGSLHNALILFHSV